MPLISINNKEVTLEEGTNPIAEQLQQVWPFVTFCLEFRSELHLFVCFLDLFNFLIFRSLRSLLFEHTVIELPIFCFFETCFGPFPCKVFEPPESNDMLIVSGFTVTGHVTLSYVGYLIAMERFRFGNV